MSLKECVYVPNEMVKETLTQDSSPGKRLLEPLKTFAAEKVLPMNILEDKEITNEAEVHRHEGDLWFSLEGEVTFVYGGSMVTPWAKKLADGGVDDREIKAKEIAEGTTQVLRPGDWLWIPAGQPHMHIAEGAARLAIIKVPACDMVPLEAVPGWEGEAR